MFSLLVCSLLFIRSELNIYKTGFYFNENGGQHLIIDLIGSLRNVNNVHLMTKTNGKNDYLSNYKQNTKTIRNEKGYEEFNEKLSESNFYLNSFEESKELVNQEFYSILVDMKDVDKSPFVTYIFHFKLENNENFMTMPFHYSRERQKWDLGHSKLDLMN